MDRSHGFGSHKDKLCLLSLRFPPGYALLYFYPKKVYYALASNSLALITCKPIIQKVRQFFACFAIHGFQFFFTLALLFFSTFPHGTLFSIGVCSYLALDVLFTFLQASLGCSTLIPFYFSPHSSTRGRCCRVFLISPPYETLLLSLVFSLSPTLFRFLAFLGSSFKITPISTRIAMVFGFTYFAHRYFRYLS